MTYRFNGGGWRYLLAGLLATIQLAGCNLTGGGSQRGIFSEAAVADLALSQASAARPTDPDLNVSLDSVASQYQGALGVFVKHLGTGETATLNAEQPMRAASLYKLFVLYTAYAQMQAGTLGPNEVLFLSETAAADDPYVEWRSGTSGTTVCLLEDMIAVSSNAATDMLVERLGGRERINATMRSIGVQQVGVDDEGYAYTSAADVAILLEQIATHKAISTDASDAMLKLLEAQRRNDRLPLPLPLNVRVAHKTGELTGLRNDAGVVFAPSGPYIFVALASGAHGDAPPRQAVLDLSQHVYAHFQPGGLTAYKGLPPRLAQEVFRVPDAKGRLAPLDDEWSETVSVAPAGVVLAQGVTSVRLREMVMPDLLQMQRAARSPAENRL